MTWIILENSDEGGAILSLQENVKYSRVTEKSSPAGRLMNKTFSQICLCIRK